MEGRKHKECKGSCKKEFHPDTSFRGSSEREVVSVGRRDAYIVWLGVTPQPPLFSREPFGAHAHLGVYNLPCPEERADKHEHRDGRCHNLDEIYPKNLCLEEMLFSFSGHVYFN